LNIQMTGRHVKITQAMKDFAKEKIETITKYSLTIVKVHVLMDVQKDRHECEINIEGKPLKLHARATSLNMYESIAKCVDKIHHQIRNQKTTYHDKKNRRMATKQFEKEIVDAENDDIATSEDLQETA